LNQPPQKPLSSRRYWLILAVVALGIVTLAVIFLLYRLVQNQALRNLSGTQTAGVDYSLSQSPTVETTVEPASIPTTDPNAPLSTQWRGAGGEAPVTLLPLAGPAAQSKAEFSGMAWYGDTLILLPQYPSRFGNVVFGLPKAAILSYLAGTSGDPLEPLQIPLITGGLEDQVDDFEGFEAIAFAGDQVYLAIEASPGRQMLGHLVAGRIAPDLSAITLDPATLVENPPQAQIDNFTDESLLVFDGALYTFFENYGLDFNPHRVAHCFGFDLQPCPTPTLPFPAVEYRLTDVTPPNAQGRFWAINYFFTGDTKIAPQADPLAEQYGQGPTHAIYDTVERLVEFQIGPSGITFTGTAPIQLQLLEGDESRNWEGIALLDDQGFLVVTDKFPETLLAFISWED